MLITVKVLFFNIKCDKIRPIICIFAKSFSTNLIMVDKYTQQVLDFLRDSSKEIKDAEWDRISNLGLPNVSAFTFVEEALKNLSLRSEKAKLNLLDNDYCALYDGNEQLDFAA